MVELPKQPIFVRMNGGNHRFWGNWIQESDRFSSLEIGAVNAASTVMGGAWAFQLSQRKMTQILLESLNGGMHVRHNVSSHHVIAKSDGRNRNAETE